MTFSNPPLPLRDVHVPPASWWPPAPGWWMLAALFLLLVAVGLVVRQRRARRNAWRSRVLGEIDLAAAQHRSDADFAAALHQLLRRVARRYDPGASTQSGEAWRKTLECVPVDSRVIQTLMSIETRMYRRSSDFDRNAAQQAARVWMSAALQGVAKIDGTATHG